VVELIVPAGEGRAVRVPSGSRFRVVDVEGGQVADLFAFVDEGDGGPYAEWMSAEHTRPSIRRLFPKPGDVLLSNRRRPMARLEEDRSPGRHDTLYAACDPARYALLGVSGPHRSCATNLAEALGHAPTVVPQPFNLFMDVEVGPDGALGVRPASTQPGDSVTFTALMDLVVAVSSCPMDVVAISTGGVTPLAIEVVTPS
jgi:uncharacterized protein